MNTGQVSNMQRVFRLLFHEPCLMALTVPVLNNNPIWALLTIVLSVSWDIDFLLYWRVNRKPWHTLSISNGRIFITELRKRLFDLTQGILQYNHGFQKFWNNTKITTFLFRLNCIGILIIKWDGFLTWCYVYSRNPYPCKNGIFIEAGSLWTGYQLTVLIIISD